MTRALPGLSIERAPALTVPLRFLITAPWFAVLAGLVLLWAGPGVVASRWSPPVLAATHLLTLGFMAHAMLGALLQLLPVVAGVPIPRSRPLAAVSHPTLALGTLALAGGFVLRSVWWLRAGVVLLAIAFAVYLGALSLAYLRARPRDDSARAILVAGCSLLVTVALGLTLGTGLGWGLPLPLVAMTRAHVGWGIVGWTVVLVLGAALAIVPMFQMTPLYPPFARRVLPWAILAALLAWSAALLAGAPRVAVALEWVIALAVASFALLTLGLQQRSRRRRQPDVTFHFWRLGMICLAATVLVWAAGNAMQAQDAAAFALLLGVLAIPGFALSVISGMLYRIVPFLLWIYLQLRVGGRPPQVGQLLPEQRGKPQLWVHVAAVGFLVLAIGVWPPLIYPGALALALSGVLLGINLARAAAVAARHVGTSEPLPQRTMPGRWRSL